MKATDLTRVSVRIQTPPNGGFSFLTLQFPTSLCASRDWRPFQRKRWRQPAPSFSRRTPRGGKQYAPCKFVRAWNTGFSSTRVFPSEGLARLATLIPSVQKRRVAAGNPLPVRTQDLHHGLSQNFLYQDRAHSERGTFVCRGEQGGCARACSSLARSAHGSARREAVLVGQLLPSWA